MADHRVKNGMRNVVFLGLVSCFSDVSGEMVYPLIPLYLTSALGATPAIVGLTEGVAESLASLLKVAGGYACDRFRRKKALAFSGYAAGLVYRLALLFASSWTGILAARVIDRFGKGIRTAPRDVMIAESSGPGGVGKAFGVHKMLDMAGSAAGILAAFFLVRRTGAGGCRLIFALSVIPLAVALALFAFIREKRDARPAAARRLRESVRGLDGRLRLYLFVTFLFMLGNSSNSFLMLRASDCGFSTGGAVMLYFVYNLTASALALPCGRLSDRIGRKALLVGGYATFSLVYFGFAVCGGRRMMAAIFVIYGAFTAMTAGAERAFISEIAPENLRGVMLGLHSMLAGIALLPASVIAGLLWERLGAGAPFVYGGILSLAAALTLFVGLRR